MAFSAVSAVPAFVLIVFQVTTDARRFQFVAEGVLGMAIAAGQLSVTAIQWKFRIAGMIEAGVRPVRGVVTVPALVATFPIVFVIVLVAGETGVRRPFKQLDFVAILARSFSVFADERVVRRIMVEVNVYPVRLIVTVGACLGRILLVWFVLRVTGVALIRSIAMFFVRNMTVYAFQLRMVPEQFEIRELVIKRLFVESENIRIATLVVGMAGSASVAPGIFRSSVVTQVQFDIDGDEFMTIQAEISLPGAVERQVTGRTIGFDIGMAGYDIAGHDKRLDRLSCCGEACEQCKHRYESG